MGVFSSSSVSSRSRRWIAATIAVAGLSLGLATSAQAQQASLVDINRDVFNCMRDNTANAEGSIRYGGGDSGQIVVFSNMFGQVGRLSYSFSESSQTLGIRFIQGPLALTRAAFVERVRNGLNNTANACRNGQLQ